MSTMNETKHTPGEWQATDSLAAGGNVKQMVIRDGLDRPIAYTVINSGFDKRPGSPELPEVMEANARLIAAAPDLLEALQAMDARATAMGWEHVLSYPGNQSAIAKARRAIAKATGSQTAPQPTGDRVPDDVIDWDGPDREQPLKP